MYFFYLQSDGRNLLIQVITIGLLCKSKFINSKGNRVGEIILSFFIPMFVESCHCSAFLSVLIFLLWSAQGTSQSMPWLAELVESSEGSLDVLPVQCLCEFLLHDPKEMNDTDTGDDENSKAERQRRKQVSSLVSWRCNI